MEGKPETDDGATPSVVQLPTLAVMSKNRFGSVGPITPVKKPSDSVKFCAYE